MKRIVAVYKMEQGCAIYPPERDKKKIISLLNSQRQDILIGIEHGRHEVCILKSTIKPGTKFLVGGKEICIGKE